MAKETHITCEQKGFGNSNIFTMANKITCVHLGKGFFSDKWNKHLFNWKRLEKGQVTSLKFPDKSFHLFFKEKKAIMSREITKPYCYTLESDLSAVLK